MEEIVLYSESLLNKLKKSFKSLLFLIILGFVLLIIADVVSFCLLNTENRYCIEISLLIINCVVVCVLTYLLLNQLNKINKNIKHVKLIMESSPNEIKCKVISIDKYITTLSNGIETHQINVLSDDGNKIIFISSLFSISNIEVGKEYVFEIASNMVKEYRHE